MLTKLLRNDFPSHIRDRGERYHASGAVTLKTTDDHSVTLSVSGSRRHPYDVSFLKKWHENRAAILGTCSCPHYEEGFACKHLWAAIRKLDEQKPEWGSNLTAPFFIHADEDPDLDDDNGFKDNFDDADLEEEDIPFEFTQRNQKPVWTLPTQKRINRPSSWKKMLEQLQSTSYYSDSHSSAASQKKGLWHYVIKIPHWDYDSDVRVIFHHQNIRKDGTLGRMQATGITYEDILALPEEPECALLMGLMPALPMTDSYASMYGGNSTNRQKIYSLQIPPFQYAAILSKLAQTGRLWGADLNASNNFFPLSWESDSLWTFELQIQKTEKSWEVKGSFRKEAKMISLFEVDWIVSSGLLGFNKQLLLFNDNGLYRWILFLKNEGECRVPFADEKQFSLDLYRLGVPMEQIPPELRREAIHVVPKPLLVLMPLTSTGRGPQETRYEPHVSFDYGGHTFKHPLASEETVQTVGDKILIRDLNEERRRLEELSESGFTRRGTFVWRAPTHDSLSLSSKNMANTVLFLMEKGWEVSVGIHKVKTFRGDSLEISTGIDWFELEGTLHFDETSLALPTLLEGLNRRRRLIQLLDGSLGLVTDELAEKYTPLSRLGRISDKGVRYSMVQAPLVNTLLENDKNLKTDDLFRHLLEKLISFSGIKSGKQPKGFKGTLRPYQKEGLGWLGFLREYGFGGCLADEMGLGKTVQVLALLEQGRQKEEKRQPVLVVVPRSLVFNWLEEIARFAPRLTVANYTGLERALPESQTDLIITTYGILRKDLEVLSAVKFDTVILDEAHVAKNSQAQTSKAVKALNADHRLALTGTPVENHLGELFSLFDFLNPGLLGETAYFKKLSVDLRSPEAARSVARGLKPFILRRTKAQVIRDLPEKTEQTIYCELDPVAQKLYDELKNHYRKTLLEKTDGVWIKKNKIMVLEALLRLRQTACHPGLVNPIYKNHLSAKLESLLEQLEEVIDGGHKVLIFSQFTSLLSLVEQQLKQRRFVYEYLDGQTRDRQARVERFQKDETVRIFLISLKAGGLGLNLTAADYVFILDPWWNPAVEAQAIDRAHRIGQKNKVFAYRFIAKNTVEEKILELQSQKRALAEAILTESTSFLKALTRNDLELLLG